MHNELERIKNRILSLIKEIFSVNEFLDVVGFCLDTLAHKRVLQERLVIAITQRNTIEFNLYGITL